MTKMSKKGDFKNYFVNLIPFPQEVKVTSDKEVPAKVFLKDIPGDVASIAKQLLKAWLVNSQKNGFTLNIAVDPHLKIGKSIKPELKKQSYQLVLKSKKCLLTAASKQGVLYGLQTLKQILEDADLLYSSKLPEFIITDWPRLEWRAIHIDIAREMEYRHSYFKSVIDRLAYFKLNALHIYLENKFAYAFAPEIVPPRVMTPDEAKDLSEYAQKYGITIIPQIPTMGHMEHFLQGPYVKLRENPKEAHNICPSHPETRPFISKMIAEIAAAFPASFLHVGYDESHSGICERCQKVGTPQEILANHLNWLNEEVHKHGKITMIYGDKFISRDEFPTTDAANGGTIEQAHKALSKVSKDIIITDWHYTAPYGGTVKYFVENGFTTHIVTATNIYWHDSIPYHRSHHWIVETYEQAIAEGAKGAIHSNWELRRGQFFENFWFFQGLAAERMWLEKPHNYLTWSKRFSLRFWGLEQDYYAALGGLAESIPTDRTRHFCSCSPLQVEIPKGIELGGWYQARREYPEIGTYLVKLAQEFKKQAKRNANSLEMMDIFGHMITYLGIRSRAKYNFEKYFEQYDKEEIIKSLKSVKDYAEIILKRLNYGYQVYGGAVEDRKMLETQIQTLERYIQSLNNISLEQFKNMSLDDFLMLSESISANKITPFAFLKTYTATDLIRTDTSIQDVSYPSNETSFKKIPYLANINLGSILNVHNGEDGLVYVKTSFKSVKSGKGKLLYGADGPVKVWFNKTEVDIRPDATNPATPDEYSAPITIKEGENEVVFAIRTNYGKAWGIITRYVFDE